VRAADDLPLDAEHLAEAHIEAVGQHDEARGDFLIVGEHDLLAVLAGRNRHGLGKDLLDVAGNFAADGRDELIIGDAELLARCLVEQGAESRDPVRPVMGGLGENSLRQARSCGSARSARRG